MRGARVRAEDGSMATTQLQPALTGARRTNRCADDDRFDDLRRSCPSCGALGVRIVYGYPNRVLSSAARRGKVVLGGCTHRGSTHQCPEGHQWEDLGSLH